MTEEGALAAGLERFPRWGRLTWIGVRPARRQPEQVVSEAMLEMGHGVAGDRAGQRPGGRRQVTLIQAEHLPVLAALCGLPAVAPDWLRRNLVVAGINLLALRERRFRVGSAVLEGTGHCHPCARMEEVLGPGGLNAMRGHGGITARVVVGGVIRVGDAVDVPAEP